MPLGEAGQTKPGVILVHQRRTVSLDRVVGVRQRSGGRVYRVTDPTIRHQVRMALERHLGLDIPPALDGAE
jgi:hypothetical protein